MSIKVLVCDDDRLSRMGTRVALASAEDIRVVGETSSGRAAVAMADELHPDVVLMDVAMPEGGGHEATREIVRLNCGIRVIAVSAHSDPWYPRVMLEAGAAGYVLKTVLFEELSDAIRTVMEGGMHVSPRIAFAVASVFPKEDRR